MYCKCRLTYIYKWLWLKKLDAKGTAEGGYSFDLSHRKNECPVPDGKYVKQIQYHAKKKHLELDDTYF